MTGSRPSVGLLYSSAAPAVLEAAGERVELIDVIPERLFYDLGPGHPNRFHVLDAALEELRRYALGREVSGHGIGLSLPSDMPLDTALLDMIVDLDDRYSFEWYSEHLSSFATMRGSVPNAQAGLGLPVPYDWDVLDMLASKVDRVQDRIGVQLLMENPAVFTPIADSDLHEADFLNELTRRTGCGVLLDLHNLYTNLRNHGDDPGAYIDRLDHSTVVEVHLAGGTELFGFYTDSHAELTPRDVWELAEAHLASMPALRSIVFEFHESSIDRLGVDSIVAEIERMHVLAESIGDSRPAVAGRR
jgi:uncharacterized protein